jgi:Carbohydrate binding domain
MSKRSSPMTLIAVGLLTGCAAGPAAEPKRPEATPTKLAEAPVRAAVPKQVGTLTAGKFQAAGNNMLWNATFDSAVLRPCSLAFDSPKLGHGATADGELCLHIENGGAHTFDVVLRQGPLAIARGHKYQFRLRTHATAGTRLRVKVGSVGVASADYWTAEGDSGPEAKTWAGPSRVWSTTTGPSWPWSSAGSWPDRFH